MLSHPNVHQEDDGAGSPHSSSASRRWFLCGFPGCAVSSSDMSSQADKPSCLSTIKSQSLRETLQKNPTDGEKRRLTTDTSMTKAVQRLDTTKEEDASSDSDEMMKALQTIAAREEEIEKRKVEVRQRVQAKLSKVEVEARSLDTLRKELESLDDPNKKEVNDIRKRIEAVEKELKPLKQMCEKKEKEYHDVVKQHEEKSKLKADLVSKLLEVVGRSEQQRMKKLDDLISHFETMAADAGLISSPGPLREASPAPAAAV